MRQAALLSVVFWCLFSRARSVCDQSGQLETNKTFPDIVSTSYIGYQISTEFANKQTKETVFVVENYNTEDNSGKLEIYRNGDFKQFVYFSKSDEAFVISGSKCETKTILDTPPFQEDVPVGWLDFEDNITVLGPSAVLRKGFVAWNDDHSRVGYYGEIETDRGIMLDKWKQCIKDGDVEGEIQYYFGDPLWHNAINFTDLQVPVRVHYIKGPDKQTLEFFDYQPFLSNVKDTQNVPEGYGCDRTAKNEEDIPVVADRNHLLRGEMVYHSINRDAKKYSRFISTFQIAYHSASEMMAYSYAPWKKGSTNKDGTIKSRPYTRVIWDNKNSFIYLINLEDRSCSYERDTQFYPSFDLPDDSEGNINLMDPNILVSNDGFKYLGERMERDIPVFVFEKEVRPMFLGDKEAPVGVITRIYSSHAVMNTGNQEIKSPVRITIQWYDDVEKTKIRGYLVVNIFSYANDVPSIRNYFNVMPCFKNYDDYMWIEVIFPPMGVTKDALLARSEEIENEFMGVLYTSTETTPARIPRLFVDVTDDDFSVNAMILDRPPIGLEFDLRGNYEITSWDTNVGIVSEDECMKKCAEYNLENNDACRAISYCGSTCYLSTKDKPAATDNTKCRLYDRQITSNLPSMENIARGIRKKVVSESDPFSIGFEVNVGDQVQFVSFRATSFADTVGDITERLVPQPQIDKFSLSMAGMRLSKGSNDEFKPFGKYDLSACMQICLNDPYCETLSYCKDTDCVVSKDVISDINVERIVKNYKCIIYARDYIQAYELFPGVVLTTSADNVLNANGPTACARECSKESKFNCRSFDYCENKKDCLLHTTHYIELKKKNAGMEIKENCTHYSKKFIYDYKVIPSQKTLGDVATTIAHNTVEECAKECTENGAFECTSFDFCEGTATIDDKCYLISTPLDDTKITHSPLCRHYLNQGATRSTPSDEKRYTTGLAGGLGFMFFIIGAVIGLGATYFFAFKYANRG